jgi:hypothetical protein
MLPRWKLPQLPFSIRYRLPLAAHVAVPAMPAPVPQVGLKLPDFWVKDPQMWFSQAEAQLRLA